MLFGYINCSTIDIRNLQHKATAKAQTTGQAMHAFRAVKATRIDALAATRAISAIAEIE